MSVGWFKDVDICPGVYGKFECFQVVALDSFEEAGSGIRKRNPLIHCNFCKLFFGIFSMLTQEVHRGGMKIVSACVIPAP